MRPSHDAATEAAATISKYRNADDYQGAITYVGSLGGAFAERISKFCGEDWYRLGRTLEVALTANSRDTKERLYTGERQGGLASLGYDTRCFFLCPNDRMKHTEVVDERCERMIQLGLIKETSNLCLAGRMPDMASRAIGYRQTMEYLEDDGVVPSEEDRFMQFLNNFTTATRRYAKQQMSWFRKDKDFMFVPISLDSSREDRVKDAAEEIQRYCEMSRGEYDLCLSDADGESNRLKKQNLEQGKKMKFYQFKRHILRDGSDELRSALSEALDCRQRMQAKRRRVGDHEEDTSK